MPPYPTRSPIPVEAQPVVDRYSVICDQNYYARLRALIAALRNASKAIDIAAGHFPASKIDAIHWARTKQMLASFEQPDDWHPVHRFMLEDVGYFDNVASAIEVATYLTGQDGKKKETVIPEHVYIDATSELIAAYEATWGQIVYPDARMCSQGESTQASTHFIARSLVAIDPSWSLKMVVTCIKKVGVWGNVKGTNLKLGDVVVER